MATPNLDIIYGDQGEAKAKEPAKDLMTIQQSGKHMRITVDGKELWVPSPSYVENLENRFYDLAEELRLTNQRIRYLEANIRELSQQVGILSQRLGGGYDW